MTRPTRAMLSSPLCRKKASSFFQGQRLFAPGRLVVRSTLVPVLVLLVVCSAAGVEAQEWDAEAVRIDKKSVVAERLKVSFEGSELEADEAVWKPGEADVYGVRLRAPQIWLRLEAKRGSLELDPLKIVLDDVRAEVGPWSVRAAQMSLSRPDAREASATDATLEHCECGALSLHTGRLALDGDRIEAEDVSLRVLGLPTLGWQHLELHHGVLRQAGVLPPDVYLADSDVFGVRQGVFVPVGTAMDLTPSLRLNTRSELGGDLRVRWADRPRWTEGDRVSSLSLVAHRFPLKEGALSGQGALTAGGVQTVFDLETLFGDSALPATSLRRRANVGAYSTTSAHFSSPDLSASTQVGFVQALGDAPGSWLGAISVHQHPKRVMQHLEVDASASAHRVKQDRVALDRAVGTVRVATPFNIAGFVLSPFAINTLEVQEENADEDQHYQRSMTYIGTGARLEAVGRFADLSHFVSFRARGAAAAQDLEQKGLVTELRAPDHFVEGGVAQDFVWQSGWALGTRHSVTEMPGLIASNRVWTTNALSLGHADRLRLLADVVNTASMAPVMAGSSIRLAGDRLSGGATYRKVFSQQTTPLAQGPNHTTPGLWLASSDLQGVHLFADASLGDSLRVAVEGYGDPGLGWEGVEASGSLRFLRVWDCFSFQTRVGHRAFDDAYDFRGQLSYDMP